MTKIEIDAIPELKTAVGIQGSTRQKEVGGPFCVAVVVAIIYSGSDESSGGSNG